MKKKIIVLLVGCIILSCMCIPISAATRKSDAMPLWTNISYVRGTISFAGTSGNYSMVIRGANGVDTITATATLYYKNSNGDWIEIPKDWEYSVNDDTLTINEEFTGVSGREYKVELDATVYKDGYGEPVSKSSFKECP